MTEPMPGGRRRVDKVLDPDFLAELRDLTLDELRHKRHMAEQEEADLSYLRRMLHGRIDTLRDEQLRRGEAGSQAVIDHLSDVLADHGPRPAPFGLGRHVTVEPEPASGSGRRRLEQLLLNPHYSDPAALGSPQLASLLDELVGHEKVVSEVRRRVQQVVDACSHEIARRYRDGEADIGALLPQRQ